MGRVNDASVARRAEQHRSEFWVERTGCLLIAKGISSVRGNA